MLSQFIYVSAESRGDGYDDYDPHVSVEVLVNNANLVNLVWSHVGYSGQRLFVEKIKASGDLMQDIVAEMPQYGKFNEEETVYIYSYGNLVPLIPSLVSDWEAERLVRGEINLVRKVSLLNTGDAELDKKLARAKKKVAAEKKKAEEAKIKNKERTEARKIANAKKLLEKAGKKVVDG
jgi:hypothetical protein